MKKLLFIFLLAVYALSGFAQADRQYIRSGNKFYRQQNFVKAEAEYRKSLSANPDNPQALYNLCVADAEEGFCSRAAVSESCTDREKSIAQG